MLPVTERLADYDATVYLALDTIKPLTAHVQALIAGDGTPRTMTLLSRYRTAAGTEDSGFASTSIETALSMDEVEVRDNLSSRDSYGVTFHLTPAINRFGFSAHQSSGGTEREVTRRYWAQGGPGKYPQRRDLTVVHVQGRPGNPNRSDRIHIEDWNSHGVCHDILVLFS